MHDDFGIATGAKFVAESRKLGHQLLEVINLTIVHYTNGSILVEYRLITGSEINDREPPVTEAYPWRVVEALAVRTPMSEDIGHSAHQSSIDFVSVSGVEDPGDATHFQQLPIRL
jgi:hypothetical protein